MKHIYLISLKFIRKLLFILVYLRINNNNKKNSVEIVNILKYKKWCYFTHYKLRWVVQWWGRSKDSTYSEAQAAVIQEANNSTCNNRV